jgi:hypothetical protein
MELRYMVHFKHRLLQHYWLYGIESGRVDGGEETGQYASPLAVAKATGSRGKKQSGYYIAATRKH